MLHDPQHVSIVLPTGSNSPPGLMWLVTGFNGPPAVAWFTENKQTICTIYINFYSIAKTTTKSIVLEVDFSYSFAYSLAFYNMRGRFLVSFYLLVEHSFFSELVLNRYLYGYKCVFHFTYWLSYVYWEFIIFVHLTYSLIQFHIRLTNKLTNPLIILVIKRNPLRESPSILTRRKLIFTMKRSNSYHIRLHLVISIFMMIESSLAANIPLISLHINTFTWPGTRLHVTFSFYLSSLTSTYITYTYYVVCFLWHGSVWFAYRKECHSKIVTGEK